jgi:hypothetical protein
VAAAPGFRALVAADIPAISNLSGTASKSQLPALAVYSDQSNSYSAGTQDFSGAAHTLPVLKGLTASKPATCTIGELYFATDATAGQNLYECSATNVWTQQLNSGGGAIQCSDGLGDGLNAIPAGTYVSVNCYNSFGVTYTITGIRCFSDNNGTSTLNAASDAGAGLLTAAFTCNSGFAAGTQSATTNIASGHWIEFTFVSDGATHNFTAEVTATR